MSATSLFTVLVAFDNSPSSQDAVLYASDLCRRLNSAYRLLIIFVVALNPKPTVPVPGIDHLESALNADIEAAAEKEIIECRQFLETNLWGKVAYEMFVVEGEGETGPVIEKYVREKHPETNLFVIGTRNNEGIKRWILGSVSEHCIHHLPVPVLVIK